MNNPWSDRPWRLAAVYGLGLSGRAAARWLLDQGIGVLAIDRRPPQELDLTGLAGERLFGLIAGGDPERLPDSVDGLVLSPGVPAAQPLVTDARERGLPVISEIELAFAQLARPELGNTILALTGSNGKSTTTALAGGMLTAAGLPVEVCGNIGEPISGCIDGPAGRFFVVELSSFQLETVDTFRPRAAALLNLAPDHLDRYPDFDAYVAAKRRIFARQQADDVAILNADDPVAAATPVAVRRRLFSRLRPVGDGCFVDGDRVVESGPDEAPRELFAVGELALAGVHNLENALAAALLARAAGVPAEAIRRAVSGFRGLPHRLQPVAETAGGAAGVAWYDDSKATNPAATAKSLEGFADSSVHLILGGRNKGADFADLVEPVRRKARRLYLIGEASEELASALADAAPIELCGTLEAAVERAGTAAQPGEVVVLSPACASFDQFTSFAERGDRFQALVATTSGRGHGQEAGV